MTWNPNHDTLTLLLENHGSTRQPRYKLTGWMRRTTPDGETSLTPIPHFAGLRDVTFAQLEINPPWSGGTRAPSGELTLLGHAR